MGSDPEHQRPSGADPCATPNTGCKCADLARVVGCGVVARRSGNQIWCSTGERTCSPEGKWGKCELNGETVMSASPEAATPQALGTTQACIDNPCDPFCQQVSDSGSDLDLPNGFQETVDGSITLSPAEGSLNDTGCTGIELVPPEQTLTVSTLPGSEGSGLLAELFDDPYLGSGIPADATPVTTRVDPQINFDWGSGGPGASGIGADAFSVRWTGFLRPEVTRAYQLCISPDDGGRIWLDDQLVVDSWVIQGATEHCMLASPTLTAGTFYKLRVEYDENAGAASAKLLWKHAGVPGGEVVPGSVLRLPGSQDLPAGFSVDPALAQFDVRALPDGCFDGPIRAAWAVDKLDRSQVDNFGRVSLFAPVAGDITTTAYVGDFSATGIVHVVVDARDVSSAPPGTLDLLDAAPAGTDPMTVLYPYVDTVFPLAIRAPTIQWDTGGTAASAVVVGLRYPADGSVFSWSKLMAESVPPRFTIPQQVWAELEASAKGEAAAYFVQRVTGGVLRPEVVRDIRFASAPVRGKIYYTQYGRNGSTNIMVADPASSSTATSVFADDAGGTPDSNRKCPVCHSVSANGTMFATADKSFSANGGLSKINPDGSFTLLSDYTATVSPYRDGQQDWRGFAWSPLTPDGKLALAAANIWGNSRQQVVGIDEPSRTVSIPGTYLSGGSGTGLLAKYYLNTGFTGWDWRRFDPKVDFNWGAASPGGPLPADFSVAWTGQVQAYTSETYTFAVEASGGVRLSVGGNVIINQLGHANNAGTDTFAATVAMTKGAKVAIALDYADTATNAQVYLRWSAPSVPLGLVPQTQLYPNDGWHGVLATFYDNDNFTNPFISDRIESNIDAAWGTGGPRPLPSGDNDNWSAIFQGQLQAPVSGDVAICARHDDDVVVSVAGTQRISVAGVGADDCSAPFAVTEGTKYDLEVRFKELGGDAYLNLSWKMAGVLPQEIIPSARLFPPAGWAPPVHGLTATYYDTDNFNRTLASNSKAFATQRVEQNADLSWGDGRPEHSSAITSNDSFTSRLTGRLEAPCSGVYELEVYGDDGGRLWIDGIRVIHLWNADTKQGATWLDAGMHDIKIDHREDSGGANLVVRWKPTCQAGAVLAPIPNANLYPSGDAGSAGFVREGGDNGNSRSYYVWQTPTAAGQPSTDVTGASPGRWGLGWTIMMVPSFSPDGSKLVFIDGDSAADNGWRKGLSTFSFDQSAKLFRNRKTIVSTWPNGDVMKWPVFESDSRSIIYQATVPADVCCRKSDWTKYGYMGPTNYFEDPGRLLSVDSEAATPVPVELAKLNQGERALDRNKAYQATVLPQASAGYRWAVFTSTRPYGNTLNLQGQQDFSDTSAYTYISDYGKVQSMLWVSAIDDVTSAGADRSHPAFFLPNQNFSENASNGFLNERAYWVTEACRPAGAGAGSSCDVDEDCCGGAEGTAACRIDTPATVPPTRHCFALPDAGNCAMPGNACASGDDCCMGSVCDDGLCVKPPAFAKYQPANFERIYESSCSAGTKVEWTFFDYKASVPAVGGALQFYAESADNVADFETVPVYPAPVNLTGVALLGSQGPPGDLTSFTTIAEDAPLDAAEVVERKYLKITIRFIPNDTGIAAPILSEWRQAFSCPPGE